MTGQWCLNQNRLKTKQEAKLKRIKTQKFKIGYATYGVYNVCLDKETFPLSNDTAIDKQHIYKKTPSR